ncbi:MAG: ABC transporter ATP-binding protein [Candidatus Pacebacteria bacterium]|nr:ABC transporter ATP-binding protein [Candidatus Paceibacterota bacterium]
MNTEQEDKTEEKKITKEGIYTGFSVMFKYLKGYRRDIIILSIIGVLSALGNGVIPYIAGSFFDSISNPSVTSLFGYVIPLYVSLLILWSIVQCLTYFMDWRINIMSQYISNTIWLEYISKGFGFLLNLPVAFHKKNKIGEIGNNINYAANSLETIVSNVVIDLSPQILSIVIAFGIALYIKQVLALFLMIGVVIYVFVLLNKVKPLAKYQKEYYDHISKMWGDAYDTAGNALAIKQATSEQYEQNKLLKGMLAAVPMWMKQTKVWGNLSLYQRITILGTQILIFIFSVYYIHQGAMTLGELLAFNAYAAMVFGPFTTIARNWQTIQNGIINIQETEKILALPTENYEPIDAPVIDIRGDIDFKNVSFQYDEGKSVLQDISFSIKAGEIIALVGESGVGKSTLIDLISAYHFANSGDVFIDGYDVKTLNLRKLRQAIAVVPQEVVLFNDTIETNIKYGNFEATHEEIREASRKAHALDFIEKFPEQWKQLVGERGIKLSVGQKQRIAIARAILRNPKILVLDEPTSALDAGTEKIITESLDKLMTGKTTFIIAHRLSTVRKADKILVFKEGKIIESGKHDELLKIEGGEYRRLYELQIGLHA